MARNDFNTQGWREVSRETPCGACGRHHGCREARDGNFICWRIPSQHPRGAGWWHRRDGETEIEDWSLPVLAQAEAIADQQLLHRVYSDLLMLCPLSGLHRKHLQNEGWAADEVQQFRAGSWPETRLAQKAVMEEMWASYGSLLAQIPGFVVKAGPSGGRASLCASPGLLLPCAGWGGRIYRMRMRPDVKKNSYGPKYVWLSSSSQGGPSSGSPPAFYRPNDEEPPRRLLITEGEKKAYLASLKLSGQGFPVIGISLAGVGNHRELLPILQENRGAFDDVVIAFDEDSKEETRKRVETHERNLCEALAGMGIPVLMASWRGPKGLDDLLVARGSFQLTPFQPLSARPTLVDAPEKVAARPAKPRQMVLGEVLPQRRKMTLAEARAFMKRELDHCFRQDDLGEQVILLRARPGVGKTHLLTELSNELSLRRSMQGKRLINVTPRHDFAEQGRDDWNVVTGLNYKVEQAEACHQLRYVNQAQALNIPRQVICERCPLRQACESNRGRNAAEPFYLEMINSLKKCWQINQNLLGRGRGIWQNEKLGLLTMDDVEFWQVLVQERTIGWNVIKNALEWCEKDKAYQPLQPLLQVLLEAGQSLDATDPEAELFERTLLEKLDAISQGHGMDLAEILSQARQAKEPALFQPEQQLHEGSWSIPPRLRDLLVGHLERELRLYRQNPIEGWNRRFYVNRDGLMLFEAQPFNGNALRGVPIVIASASMTEEQVREFFPDRRVTVIEPELEMPAGVHIRQYLDKNYGKSSLLGEMDFTRARDEVKKIVDQYPGEKVGLVTHKATAERMLASWPAMKSLHYYGQRGSNELEDSRTLVVLGTPCPNPEGLLRQAEAYYGDGRKLHGYSVLKQYQVTVQGEKLEVSYRTKGDSRLQTWMDAKQGQELFQAIGRGRLYNTENSRQYTLFPEDGKRTHLDVHVFTSLPIPGIEVHEYVSDIGVQLKKKKLLDLTRVTLLAQAIQRVRAQAGKLTYAQLVKDTGISLRLVRRLFRAALLSLETAKRAPKSSSVMAALAECNVCVPSEPFLEQGVGLPPPLVAQG